MAQRIVIMAGGTGGHVFPALAVAQEMMAQGWHVSWLGTAAGLESRVVPEHSIEIDWLSVAGFRGKGLQSKLMAVFRLLKACQQALVILRRRRPNVVLGMGGFVAGPGGLMARLLGIPLVIHEQNKIPGTTNRLLAKITSNIVEAFEGSFDQKVKPLCTGNPLRKELLTLNKTDHWHGNREFRVLIIGGSQGASILNTVIPEALATFPELAIQHQTGKAMEQEVRQQYRDLGMVSAEVTAFINDMRRAYEWADMLICRAGAMTVSEVAAAGLPAIFIPLPTAIDNHQVANAQVLVNAGAGILLEQVNLTVEQLHTQLKVIQKHYETMAKNAKKVARLDATQQVAELCKARAKS